MSKKHKNHGGEKARLSIALPTGESFKRKLIGPGLHVGSASDSGIRIVDPDVSPTHYMIVFDGNSYFAVDEGSERGTLVNGEKITKPRKLSAGDVIRCGNTSITFKQKLVTKHKKEQPVLAQPTDKLQPPQTALPNGAKEEKKKKHKKDASQQYEATPTVKPTSPDGIQQEFKKKKDQKQPKQKPPKEPKKDERVKAAMVRAWGGVIATVLSVVLTVVISMVVSKHSNLSASAPVAVGGSQGGSKRLANLSGATKFSGGTFEASGAVAVPGANAILFVDDSAPDQVFYMTVSALGEQDGPIKPIALGVSVANPEGITQFGPRFLITGSLSTTESNEAGGVATFEFDAATQTISKAVVLTGMRKFLLDNVPELRAWADKTSVEGGLNVEGIAVDPDPQHPRVLLGLRGPVLNGNALVVPIRVKNREAPLTVDNLVMDQPNAIQLNLSGQAIRDIQWDSQLRSFLIISGSPETEDRTDFILWQWSGEANQSRDDARPKQQSLLDKKMKPEGIAPMKFPNRQFVLIAGDASRYATIDYISQ
jgi:pSer/pThr/pTyr-binding forkhead associated (FHA) protein